MFICSMIHSFTHSLILQACLRKQWPRGCSHRMSTRLMMVSLEFSILDKIMPSYVFTPKVEDKTQWFRMSCLHLALILPLMSWLIMRNQIIIIWAQLYDKVPLLPAPCSVLLYYCSLISHMKEQGWDWLDDSEWAELC